MIVKFLRRGTGSCASTFDYLLGRKRDRELATVLKGDPTLTQMLAESLEFKHKYTVGVLSFQEANLDDDIKKAVIADFEKALLCGLEADQYNICWVEHRDKGRLELNFVIPRIELGTGLAMNPYFDSVDKKRMTAFCDLTNAVYDLHDPKDPKNRQLLTTPSNLPKEKKELREAITAHLMQAVENGNVKDRLSVLKELENLGLTIARITPSAISIKDPDGGKNIRLKGELYGEHFRFDEKYSKENERASRAYRENREQRIRDAKRELDKQSERKRAYNAKRFKYEQERDARDFGQSPNISTNRVEADFGQKQESLDDFWWVDGLATADDNDIDFWQHVYDSTSQRANERESEIRQGIKTNTSGSENIRQSEASRNGGWVLLHSEQRQQNSSVYEQKRTDDYENKGRLTNYEKRIYRQLNRTVKRARANHKRTEATDNLIRESEQSIKRSEQELREQQKRVNFEIRARKYETEKLKRAVDAIEHEKYLKLRAEREAERLAFEKFEAERIKQEELKKQAQENANRKAGYLTSEKIKNAKSMPNQKPSPPTPQPRKSRDDDFDFGM